MTMNIPGRDILEILRAEARKKPEIAELMRRAQTMTDEEIDALKVPMKWYKKALKRARNLRILPETAEGTMAIIHSYIVEIYPNDKDGTIRQWVGETGFVNIDRGEIEVKEGQFIWFPADGSGVLIDTIFSKRIDNRFMTTQYVKAAKRSEYNTTEALRRIGDAGDLVPFTVVAGQATEKPLRDRWDSVRITRG